MKKVYFACSIRAGRDDSDKKLSAMIDGSPNSTVFAYTDIKSAEHAISSFLSKV
jgi:hypothetical protein